MSESFSYYRLLGLALIGSLPLTLGAADNAHGDDAHGAMPAAEHAAATEITEVEETYDATAHYDTEPGEVFEIITQLAEVWDVDALDSRDVDHKLREAQVAAKARDYKLAERLFIEALNRPLTARERYWTLLQMAATYQETGGLSLGGSQNAAFADYFGDRELLRDEGTQSLSNLVKATSVYEKFLQMYKGDDLAPFVNLQLGRLYRKLGAYEMAIERFYHVMNTALSIRPANIPAYRDVTTQAKQEIAETHFLEGDYQQAIEFFSRLKLVNLENDDRQVVLFKTAYSHYMIGENDQARSQLEKFLEEFPDSILAPESYYLLANIYTMTNQPQKAVNAVIALLEEPQVQDPRDQRIWLYWQKKAANELANEFYEQNDYLSALRIYQEMRKLDTTAEWRAPIMYQIGLCFTRMEAPQQGLQVFDNIIKGNFWDKESEPEIFEANADYQPSEDVKTLQELAKWHAKHIAWNIKASNRMQRLMELSEEGS